MEGPKCCMNVACRATLAAGEWRKGWGMRSGGYAVLCNTCGAAYEQLVFCDVFHANETGWRDCSSCRKRLHCGCIASKSFVELVDSGGVQCINCMKNLEMKNLELSSIQTEVIQESSIKCPQDGNTNVATSIMVYQPIFTTTDITRDGDNMDKNRIVHMGKDIEVNGQSSNGLLDHIKREDVMLSVGSLGNASFSITNQAPQGSFSLRCNDSKDNLSDRRMRESLPQTCLDISLGTFNPQNVVEACYNAGNSHDVASFSKRITEEREQSKSPSAIQQWQRAHYLLPKPPRTGLGSSLETSKDMLQHIRVARPPAEGRGRNQLLPRYWPRITDQELQQISGDSNSTIVPLFEKVLSASDAGRIGRLVLPKACAEAYFPPISQPEGLPLKIQDAKGKDWVFQFRFWPNNNSRMYVLEGVTPCIQSMQLQAGDTVTFSRIDPEGKLVMGFRKATNSVPLQDSQISAFANGTFGNENFLSGVIDNLPMVSGYSGLIQSMKGRAVPQLNASLELERGFGWHKMENNHGVRSMEALQLQPFVPEKRSRNIGSRSKRLHMDNEDAMQLKLTWEEAQDLLRPPPAAKPSIVVIEDHEFEEYEEPPVFGKKTIFTSRVAGDLDQWAQCDNCSKWRRLPVDVILPPNWTCTDNTWDSIRSSCSAPEEMNPKEMQNLLQQNAEMKKRKIASTYISTNPERDASGLDALATAAALGDDASPSTSSIATTTKHPRHRPGCTCIVCIQPPSGKGPKHQPSCTCNVCLTVKRRFKTLMMRKKKRQSEREEAEVQKKLIWDKKEVVEADGTLKCPLPLDSRPGPEIGHDTFLDEMGKEQIDLNYHPERAGEQAMPSRASMMSLLQVAGFPLENYMKQNGLTSLACERQVSSSSQALNEVPVETDGRTPDESFVASASRERDSGVDEGCVGSDQACTDPM